LFAFLDAITANALTLLVGFQEEHPAHTKLSDELLLVWYPSGAKCK